LADLNIFFGQNTKASNPENTSHHKGFSRVLIRIIKQFNYNLEQVYTFALFSGK
jgi:hypothetical protein